MSGLRHACAELARLAERLGEAGTTPAELALRLTQLRAVMARIEAEAGTQGMARPDAAIGTASGRVVPVEHGRFIHLDGDA